MAKISCKTYGFNCSFQVSGDSLDVIRKFRNHSDSVHGIEYTEEALLQLISRIKN